MLYRQDCVFYFDMNEKTGKVDWTTPHVLFDSRAIVDFNADPKTGAYSYGATASLGALALPLQQ